MANMRRFDNQKRKTKRKKTEKKNNCEINASELKKRRKKIHCNSIEKVKRHQIHKRKRRQQGKKLLLLYEEIGNGTLAVIAVRITPYEQITNNACVIYLFSFHVIFK